MRRCSGGLTLSRNVRKCLSNLSEKPRQRCDFWTDNAKEPDHQKASRQKRIITIVCFRGTVPFTGHQMSSHQIITIRCRGGKQTTQSGWYAANLISRRLFICREGVKKGWFGGVYLNSRTGVWQQALCILSQLQWAISTTVGYLSYSRLSILQ